MPILDLFSRLFTQLAVQGALLGAGVLALLALAARLQKRYGPQWLCRLWLALAVLFLLPLPLLLPRLPTPVAAPAPQAFSQPVAAPQAQAVAQPAAQPDPAPAAQGGPVLPAAAPAAPTPRLTLGQCLVLLWLAGGMAVLAAQGIGYLLWRRRMLRCAAPAGEGWQAAFARACRACPGCRPPPLLAAPALASPLVAGWLRPLLLVPETPLPGADYMLTHELTHIRRRDIAFKALLALVTAAHWYNPAAWLLQKRAVRDMESACDADVLRGRGDAYRDAYAEALLAAVRSGRGPAFSTGFALSKRAVKSRLAALWDPAPKRRGLWQIAVLVLLCANLGFLVSCGDGPEGTAPSAPKAQRTTAAAEKETAAPADRTGQETAWPDVDYLYAENLPGTPDWLATLHRCRYGRYQAPAEGRCGFAVPVGDGTVECYVSQNGGESYQTYRADLSAELGGGDFSVPAFQMVSDTTGFLVAQPEISQMYDTGSDITVWRTRDGCATWQLMGRHACPGDAENGSWHTQGFLWLNENVGFRVPHTRYDTFCLWRTVDGGATWQELDLDFLYETESWQALAFTDNGQAVRQEDIAGIHTCSLHRDAHSGQPGSVHVKCYVRPDERKNQSGPGLAFWLVTDDYGESWRVEPYNAGTALGSRTDTPAEPQNTMTREEVLAAAEAYFTWNYLDAEVPRRYAVCEKRAVSLADTDALRKDTGLGEDTVWTDVSESQPVIEYIETHSAQLVKLAFYVEYQPEILYLGPQYNDGETYVYLMAEPERTIQLTGWMGDGTAARPAASEEARALGLTERQYLMLTRQTAALYAAGLTDFADPGALSGEDLARYLTVRGREYFDQQDGWLEGSRPNQTAWMILNIDFTGREDVWSVGEEFPAERVRFTAGELARGKSLPQREPLAWRYTNEGGILTAAGTDGSGTLRQTYTFGTAAPDQLDWTARTYCTGAVSY